MELWQQVPQVGKVSNDASVSIYPLVNIQKTIDHGPFIVDLYRELQGRDPGTFIVDPKNGV